MLTKGEIMKISKVCTTSYTLWRFCPRTGFRETVHYQGALKDKPKGWQVLRYTDLKLLIVADGDMTFNSLERK